MIKPLTGRGVMLWLVFFFGVIFATNTYFIAMSVKTFSGVDEGDPYMIGMKYNQALDNRAKQAQIGWRATISSGASPSGGLRIAVVIMHADGAPESGVTLKGELRHPADENRDRTLVFRQIRPGAYVADLPPVNKGDWEVEIQNEGKIPFEASRRIWVS